MTPTTSDTAAIRARVEAATEASYQFGCARGRQAKDNEVDIHKDIYRKAKNLFLDALADLLKRAEDAERERDEAHSAIDASNRVISALELALEREEAHRESAEAALAIEKTRTRELEAGLAFYANPEIYKPHPHGPAFDRRDLSSHARALLQKGQPND